MKKFVDYYAYLHVDDSATCSQILTVLEEKLRNAPDDPLLKEAKRIFGDSNLFWEYEIDRQNHQVDELGQRMIRLFSNVFRGLEILGAPEKPKEKEVKGSYKIQ